ncbi:hypothetical protein [Leptospira broomii]|uniref:hypothetical protein n=1 Tax=Leptospira broomii TaxID=301541 RepID=UPI0018DB7BC6|nr:hypothetical protein [Leptospira broomii]
MPAKTLYRNDENINNGKNQVKNALPKFWANTFLHILIKRKACVKNPANPKAPTKDRKYMVLKISPWTLFGITLYSSDIGKRAKTKNKEEVNVIPKIL